MATRLPNASKAAPDWDRLMLVAIARAKATKDPRLAAFQTAHTKGQTSEFLKKFSIISEADILREFPDKA